MTQEEEEENSKLNSELERHKVKNIAKLKQKIKNLNTQNSKLHSQNAKNLKKIENLNDEVQTLKSKLPLQTYGFLGIWEFFF